MSATEEQPKAPEEQPTPVVAAEDGLPQFVSLCGQQLPFVSTSGEGTTREPRVTTYCAPSLHAAVALTVRGSVRTWSVALEVLGKEYNTTNKDLAVATRTVEGWVRSAVRTLEAVQVWATGTSEGSPTA